MRIGIYVDVAKDDQLRGVGFHVMHLVNELSRLDQENEYLLYFQCNILQSRSIFKHCPQQANFRLRPVRSPAGWQGNRPTLWWKYYLPFIIKWDGLDIFHGPSHFLPAIPRHKTVVTIHDLAMFTMELYSPRETAALRHWIGKALENAGRVIALSENTRQDILKLGVDAERIRVIYGGGNIVPEAKIEYSRMTELRQALRLPDKYVLFVGTLHPRKNVPFLIRSFALLKQQLRVPLGLVLAGMRGPAAEEVDALIKELGLESDVIITGYVEDWQLPLLYKMADLFVLPTRYEGFTLVTLEGMGYGVPVIATDTSSIREGTGDAARLVQVDDVEELAGAMRAVLEDEELRRRMIAQGKVQAQKFTWQNCARETLAVYQELYAARSGGTCEREPAKGSVAMSSHP